MGIAADCLMAYRRGDPDTPEAEAGALIEAEFMMTVRAFLQG